MFFLQNGKITRKKRAQYFVLCVDIDVIDRVPDARSAVYELRLRADGPVPRYAGS